MWKGLFLAIVISLPVKAEEKVWYCEMTGFAQTTIEGGDTYKTEKFKMKVSSTEVVFGTGGYFSDSTMPINRWFNQDMWVASDRSSFLYFKDGTFNYAQASYSSGSLAVTARCDDF